MNSQTNPASIPGPNPDGKTVDHDLQRSRQSGNEAKVIISQDLAGKTLLAVLRLLCPGESWNRCRAILAERRVQVNGVLAIHEGRRMHSGDCVVLTSTAQRVATATRSLIVYLDDDVVVAEKPPHVVTARRDEERHWSAEKKRLQPTLDELIQQVLTPPPQVGHGRHRQPPPSPPVIWRIQRLDRETSGLVVFARTAEAANGLIAQFRDHQTERVYHAVVLGCPHEHVLRSQLVRDRGDGRRGSSPDGRGGQLAVTHLHLLEQIGPLARVECRLETGRTHQIRIHLSEAGHMICGEPVYNCRPDGTPILDTTQAPRLALHAVRLGFRHPITGQPMNFESRWPADLADWLVGLRRQS